MIRLSLNAGSQIKFMRPLYSNRIVSNEVSCLLNENLIPIEFDFIHEYSKLYQYCMIMIYWF